MERPEENRLNQKSRTEQEGSHALKAALDVYGARDPAEKEVKISRYLEIMRERRVWAGLVSGSLASDPVGAAIDSLGVITVVKCSPARKVADIGSGGGLLGMVLAIACDEWTVTLVESSGRKAAVLAEMVGALGLSNVDIYAGRAEDLAAAQRFEVVVSRAAGSLTKIAPVVFNLLENGGMYVTIKGRGVEHEVAEAIPVLEELGAGRTEIAFPLYERKERGESRALLVAVTKI